jgi:hypothetical protein
MTAKKRSRACAKETKSNQTRKNQATSGRRSRFFRFVRHKRLHQELFKPWVRGKAGWRDRSVLARRSDRQPQAGSRAEKGLPLVLLRKVLPPPLKSTAKRALAAFLAYPLAVFSAVFPSATGSGLNPSVVGGLSCLGSERFRAGRLNPLAKPLASSTPIDRFFGCG